MWTKISECVPEENKLFILRHDEYKFDENDEGSVSNMLYDKYSIGFIEESTIICSSPGIITDYSLTDKDHLEHLKAYSWKYLDLE